MAAERTRVEIGANTYFLRTFPAFEALKIAGDLQQRFLGPILPALDGSSGEDDDARTATFMAALGKLSASLPGKDIVALADMLISPECVAVALDGAPDREAMKLDKQTQLRAFADAGEIVELATAIVRLNFLPLFQRVMALLGQDRSPLGESSSANTAIN